MSVVSAMLLTFLRNPKHRGKIDEMALNTTLKLFNEFPEYTLHTLHVMQIITLIKQTDGLYSFTLDNIGIPAVARVLHCHSTKPLVLYHACDSLCWLIDCAEDVESFTRVKGVALCLELLRSDSSGSSGSSGSGSSSSSGGDSNDKDTDTDKDEDPMAGAEGRSKLMCRCVTSGSIGRGAGWEEGARGSRCGHFLKRDNE